MHVDPRLNDIDDCLYRVAARALIIQDDKILLVQELPEMWWGFPGGGVDHGETVQSSLAREIAEELGVPPTEISSGQDIAYYNIGAVSNRIPRMNLFYKVSLPAELLQKTAHVAAWGWFTKSEFLALSLSPSYDKAALAHVVFDKTPHAQPA